METLNIGIAEKTATLSLAAVGCDYITSLGLFQLLSGTDFIDLAGSVDDSDAMLALMAASHVDLVLVDSSMEAGALTQTCRLLRELPDPPTVVVMGDVSFEVAEALVFVGVSAVLHQGLLAEDLPVALRMIHRGGALLISDSARDALLRRNSSFDPLHRSKFDRLNARERIVAQGVTEGLTNVQLAGSMHMSEATVKLLVSNVMNKLGVANRVQIAVVVTKSRVV